MTINLRRPYIMGCLLTGALVALVGCADPQNNDPGDIKPSVNTPTTPPVAQPPAATPTSPKEGQLTGFFQTGNFATVTIPGAAEGKTETLSIKNLEVKVQIYGRMARTEVKQVFHNHTDRRTEGNYEFTLPEGASISRLSMDVEGKMMEGELVEREKARQIYEQIVRQQKDPALLEWQGGNRFKTQIFPIEARADKTVVLTYEQLLPNNVNGSAYRYNLPNLVGQPQGSLFGSFSFELHAEDATGLKVSGYQAQVSQRSVGGQISLRQQKWVPSGPLEVSFTPPRDQNAATQYAQQNGEQFFLLDLYPRLPNASSKVISLQGTVLAIDTSAGVGKVELERVLKAADALLANITAAHKVQVVTGDFETRTCKPTPMKPDEARACLKGLTAGGATDLGGLLQAAAKAGASMQGPHAVVLFTDGVASIGELDADLIRASYLKTASKNTSLHTVAVGHSPDTDFLAELASAGRGHAMRMTPADDPQAFAKRLRDQSGRMLLTDIKVEVENGVVEGLVPHQAVNLAPYQSMAIMGRLDQGAATIKVSGQWQGELWQERFELRAPAKANTPLLPNFWARSVIETMQDKGIHRDKIVATSLRYGVMSRYTSFLVLENDEAYKRFKVDRRKERARQQAEAAQKVEALRKGDGSLKDLMANQEQAAGEGKSANMPTPDAVALNDEEEEDKAQDDADGDGFANVRTGTGAPANAPGDAPAEAPVMEKDLKVAERLAAIEPAPEPSADAGEDLGRIRGAGKGRYRYDSDFKRKRKPKVKKPAQRIDYGRQRMADLQKRMATLNDREKAELLELTVRYKNAGAGRQLFARLSKKASPQQTFELLKRPVVRNALHKEFMAVSTKILKAGDAPFEVAQTLWTHLLNRGDHKDLETLFGTQKLQSTNATALLRRVLSQPTTGQTIAAGLWTRWRQTKLYNPKDLYLIVTNDPTVASRMPGAVFEVCAELLAQGDPRVEVLDHMLRNARSDAELAATAPHLVARCVDAPNAPKACGQWVRKAASADPRLQEHLRTIHAKRLTQITAERRQDMGNTNLIIEAAQLHTEMGQPQQAARLLSELVEFTPHDFGARNRYAQALVDRKEIKAGCAQYAAAVQLNPSQRDTFKTMMALRRTHQDKATDIKDCITEGVSKLPVQRAVSIILTWEDPSADVDMHVVEHGGEEIWYQHRESSLGGLLYYDITDGFGPEIYVLGSGPSGQYDLSVVYYSGSTPNLKGKMTILRNAGTAQETREERPFVLPSANNSLKIPLGSLRL